MPLRPVPWATSGGADGRGGAENLVELARADTFVGSNGATGIVGINDLKVTALPTPGAAVRVVQGTAVIESKYPGVFGQSYVTQEQSYTDVPVAATGSASALTKYVYIMIEDTQYKGQVPADEKTGPYNSYQVTTDLPTFTPYILLATIEQPKSTATITNAMITDRRVVANPRTKPELRTYALVAADTDALTSTAAYPLGQTWPQGVVDSWGAIPIPSWAVYVKVVMMWTGVRTYNGNAFGGVWVQIGHTVNEDNIKTQKVLYNSANPSDVTRDTIVAADLRKIPKSMRGTEQVFFPRGCRDSTGPGRFQLDGGSSMVLQLEFMERPD